MILSLAAETDDNTRRQNLSTILKENLSQSDTVEAAKFAILWDKTVIEVGTKVQQEARMNAEIRMMTHGDEQNKNDDMVNTNGSNENRTKSPEELKLWAMIDMMIQSKQIIKKMMAE